MSSVLLDNTAGGIVHPQVVNGRNLWVAPEVQDIIDRLQNGDPSRGWEGDPALALYMGEGGRWVLNRYEAGEYHTVCLSRPNLPLDVRLIDHLVAHDTRRRTAEAIRQEVEKHNEYNVESKNAEAHLRAVDALEQVYFHVAKAAGEVTAARSY
jgi:hypothetical protein